MTSLALGAPTVTLLRRGQGALPGYHSLRCHTRWLGALQAVDRLVCSQAHKRDERSFLAKCTRC
jgi:hypothetical protein